MASCSLDHVATSGQSKDASTYTLQFTHRQWCNFIRLQVVGSILCDHVREAAEQLTGVSTHAAELWEQLSVDVAQVINSEKAFSRQESCLRAN